MDSLIETQRRLSNLIRIGTVSDVDGKGGCRVKTDGNESDFLPWLTPRAGRTIEWSEPSIDEQVVVLAPEGVINGGVVLRGLYSTSNRPPSSDGDTHVCVHGDGASFSYNERSHRYEVRLPANSKMVVMSSGGIDTTGSVTAKDNLIAGTGASGSFTTPTGQTVMVQDGIIINIY